MGFAEVFPEILVDAEEGPGDSELDRSDLAVDAAALRVDRDIVLIHRVGDVKGMKHLVLQGNISEVLLERLLVDRDFTGSGSQDDPGARGLASSGG